MCSGMLFEETKLNRFCENELLPIDTSEETEMTNYIHEQTAKKRKAVEMEGQEELRQRRKRADQMEHLRREMEQIRQKQKEGEFRIHTKISSMIHVDGSMSSINSNRVLFDMLQTGAFWRLEKDESLLHKCLRNPLFKLALRHWQPATQKEAIEFFLKVTDDVNYGQYPSILRRCPLLLKTMLGQWQPGHGEDKIPYTKHIHKRFELYSYFNLAHDLSIGRRARAQPCQEEINVYFADSHTDSEEESESGSESSEYDDDDIEDSSIESQEL